MLFRSQNKNLLDYTYPAVSLIEGKLFIKILRNIFADKRIEDTRIEYFCVSANLTKAMQVVHRRGELWKYIRASSALPPVFPPVTYEGDLLVDGVLVNNLPLEVMQKICEGSTIIGVDVSSEEDMQENYEFEPTLSGWQVLRKKLSPRQTKTKHPGIMSLIMRINEFSSVRQKHRQYDVTNYIIRPDVEGIGVFQFDDIERIIELGYQAGKQALENWLDQL